MLEGQIAMLELKQTLLKMPVLELKELLNQISTEYIDVELWFVHRNYKHDEYKICIADLIIERIDAAKEIILFVNGKYCNNCFEKFTLEAFSSINHLQHKIGYYKLVIATTYGWDVVREIRQAINKRTIIQEYREWKSIVQQLEL